MRSRPLRRKILILLAAMVGPASFPWARSAPASATTCSDPKFVTSDTERDVGRRRVRRPQQHVEHVAATRCRRPSAACSYQNWSVARDREQPSGDGAVKTYPNVHKRLPQLGHRREPQLSSFATIRSTWAARTPHVGIYNAAYDIWLNGVPGQPEVMIWTDNYRQVPAGSVVATGLRSAATPGRCTRPSDNGYIAFVPSQPPDPRHHAHQADAQLAGRPTAGSRPARRSARSASGSRSSPPAAAPPSSRSTTSR